MRAPPQSLCAVHPAVEAPYVCARCGNFMCAPCSAGDSNCPACRALQPATGFPFDERATLEQLLSHALAAYQREWKNCAVAAALYVAIVGGGSLMVGVLSSLAAMAVISVEGVGNRGLLMFQALDLLKNILLVPLQSLGSLGLMRMMLDVNTGRSPQVGRFFSDTRLLPAAMAIQLPFTLVLAGPSVASTVMRAVGWEAGGLVGAGLSLVLVPLFLFFGLGWWLFSVPELLISDCGASEAMRRALTLGHPWKNLRILGYALLASLLTLAGILACGVGVLAALPLASLLVLSLFLALRSSSQLPAATLL